jgi:hypothetical protein
VIPENEKLQKQMKDKQNFEKEIHDMLTQKELICAETERQNIYEKSGRQVHKFDY